MNEEKQVIGGKGTLEVLKPATTKSGKSKYTVKIGDTWCNWWNLGDAAKCAEANLIGKEVNYVAERIGSFVNIKSIYLEGKHTEDEFEQVEEEQVVPQEQTRLTTHTPKDTEIKRQVYLKIASEQLKKSGEGMGITSAQDIVGYAKMLEKECNKEGWL